MQRLISFKINTIKIRIPYFRLGFVCGLMASLISNLLLEKSANAVARQPKSNNMYRIKNQRVVSRDKLKAAHELQIKSLIAHKKITIKSTHEEINPIENKNSPIIGKKPASAVKKYAQIGVKNASNIMKGAEGATNSALFRNTVQMGEQGSQKFKTVSTTARLGINAFKLTRERLNVKNLGEEGVTKLKSLKTIHEEIESSAYNHNTHAANAAKISKNIESKQDSEKYNKALGPLSKTVMKKKEEANLLMVKANSHAQLLTAKEIPLVEAHQKYQDHLETLKRNPPTKKSNSPVDYDKISAETAEIHLQKMDKISEAKKVATGLDRTNNDEPALPYPNHDIKALAVNQKRALNYVGLVGPPIAGIAARTGAYGAGFASHAGTIPALLSTPAMIQGNIQDGKKIYKITENQNKGFNRFSPKGQLPPEIIEAKSRDKEENSHLYDPKTLADKTKSGMTKTLNVVSKDKIAGNSAMVASNTATVVLGVASANPVDVLSGLNGVIESGIGVKDGIKEYRNRNKLKPPTSSSSAGPNVVPAKIQALENDEALSQFLLHKKNVKSRSNFKKDIITSTSTPGIPIDTTPNLDLEGNEIKLFSGKTNPQIRQKNYDNQRASDNIGFTDSLNNSIREYPTRNIVNNPKLNATLNQAVDLVKLNPAQIQARSQMMKKPTQEALPPMGDTRHVTDAVALPIARPLSPVMKGLKADPNIGPFLQNVPVSVNNPPPTNLNKTLPRSPSKDTDSVNSEKTRDSGVALSNDSDSKSMDNSPSTLNEIAPAN